MVLLWYKLVFVGWRDLAGLLQWMGKMEFLGVLRRGRSFDGVTVTEIIWGSLAIPAKVVWSVEANVVVRDFLVYLGLFVVSQRLLMLSWAFPVLAHLVGG